MNERTMEFSLRVVRLYTALKGQEEAAVIGKQLLRSATSVGANYREACHARSTQEFVARLKICEAEAAESAYWLELLRRSGIVSSRKLEALQNEAEQLSAIFSTSTKEQSSSPHS